VNLLVFGAEGQLGSDILGRAERFGFSVKGITYSECDITSEVQVREVFNQVVCDVVINAAAYTNVDLAETEEEKADQVNRVGAGLVASQCREKGLPLIHVSTDYVFDGEANEPYSHLSEVAPQSVYGRTKADGERLVLENHPSASIIRTAWLFGEHGPNFVKTMVRLAFKREELRVVNDQLGCPTWAGDLAEALLVMASKTLAGEAVAKGIYHYCGTPQASWYDFARYVIEEARNYRDTKISKLLPITTEEFPTPATRPRYSVLDCSRIQDEFGVLPMDWKQGVKAVVKAELALLDHGENS
jgi:dTDP-4-dehydrorhamnose reductase